MEFLLSSGLFGLAVGLATFLVIGLFHPLVIKGEYYLGSKCRYYFLFAGVVFGYLSIIVDNLFLSILFGVMCFSSLWSILEVVQQKKRVEKGWFPMNPKRKSEYCEVEEDSKVVRNENETC